MKDITFVFCFFLTVLTVIAFASMVFGISYQEEPRTDNYLGVTGTIYQRVENVTCLRVDALDRFYDGKGDCWVVKESLEDLR